MYRTQSGDTTASFACCYGAMLAPFAIQQRTRTACATWMNARFGMLRKRAHTSGGNEQHDRSAVTHSTEGLQLDVCAS